MTLTQNSSATFSADINVNLMNLTGEQTASSTTTNIHRLIWPSLFTGSIIAANVLTLAAFSVEKRLRTYNNYFIINLSILDLLVGLRLIGSVVHTYIGYYPLNQSFCKILSGIGQAVTNASNFVVVIICVDRHHATYDPINHFTTRSKRKAIFLNSLAWLVAFGFWLIYVTAWEFIVDFDNGRHCIRRYTHLPGASVVFAIVMFYMPFVVIAVLYLRILRKIRQTRNRKNIERKFVFDTGGSKTQAETMANALKDTASSTLSSDDTRISTQFAEDKSNQRGSLKKVKHEAAAEMRKATRTLLFIVLSFIVSWLPNGIIQLLFAVEPVLINPGLPTSAYLFFSWMAFGNSLLNPISYAITQPLLRATLRNMLCCCFKRDPSLTVIV
ncbi:muscarinic acetylcholine receptor M2-like [Diadema setosum]|uniref:muscarinic acetylcholine receptor M2-like n=1 Tax=Diadema setosum TaxID=31175 RepID=UPI003B3AB349